MGIGCVGCVGKAGREGGREASHEIGLVGALLAGRNPAGAGPKTAADLPCLASSVLVGVPALFTPATCQPFPGRAFALPRPCLSLAVSNAESCREGKGREGEDCSAK
jgi:hypothetical protein